MKTTTITAAVFAEYVQLGWFAIVTDNGNGTVTTIGAASGAKVIWSVEG